MKIWQYNSYQEYQDIQIETNIRKIHKKVGWERERNIKRLSLYLLKRMNNIKKGICHGTRRGLEIRWFRKYLQADIIGTEISPNATNFQFTIEWDFHNVKPEWINNMDFIYSNSLDHSYDPYRCIDQWMSCLKPTGRCIIAWEPQEASEADPFGASYDELYSMITKKYQIKDTLLPKTARENKYFIVSR